MNGIEATPKTERAELGFLRTTVGTEAIRSVAALHESLVGELTDSSAHAVKFQFSGFVAETPAKFLERFPENTFAVLFCGGQLPYAGAILFSPELGQRIIAKWFNLQNAAAKKTFSALEESTFWQAAERLARVFLSVYARAGLEQPRIVGRGRLREMSDAFVSLPEIVAFKYAAEMPANERLGLPICAVLDTEIVARLVRPDKDAPIVETVSPAARAARNLPIETAVVLGSFKISLTDLAALKVGDTILLPDPDEAWLEAADSVKLLPLKVEIEGERAQLHVLEDEGAVDLKK